MEYVKWSIDCFIIQYANQQFETHILIYVHCDYVEGYFAGFFQIETWKSCFSQKWPFRFGRSKLF